MLFNSSSAFLISLLTPLLFCECEACLTLELTGRAFNAGTAKLTMKAKLIALRFNELLDFRTHHSMLLSRFSFLPPQIAAKWFFGN
jgi:hypothetical protein